MAGKKNISSGSFACIGKAGKWPAASGRIMRVPPRISVGPSRHLTFNALGGKAAGVDRGCEKVQRSAQMERARSCDDTQEELIKGIYVLLFNSESGRTASCGMLFESITFNPSSTYCGFNCRCTNLQIFWVMFWLSEN